MTPHTTNGNGIVGGNFDVFGANRTIPRAMTAFTAIAWYNSIEVIVLVFFMFKRYSGLYFWSLLVNAVSIIPYATGKWICWVASDLHKADKNRGLVEAERCDGQLANIQCADALRLGHHGTWPEYDSLLATAPHISQPRTPAVHILDDPCLCSSVVSANRNTESAAIHQTP
jgi:hypothetical protein